MSAGKRTKPTLATTDGRRVETTISEMADNDTGPLAEAQALADAMEVIAIYKPMLLDNSLLTLSIMLSDRLAQVRYWIDSGAFRHDGAA